MYVCVCMYQARFASKIRIGMIRFKTRPSTPLPFLFAWSNEPNRNICRDHT